MDEERQTVRDTVPAPGAPLGQRTVVAETVRRSPSGPEYARRVVVFVFGIVQLLLALRIILLLVAADRANGLVKAIYDISGILQAPFEGILKTDALKSGGSVLDISAVVAIIGWTVLELIIVAGIGIARREA